MLSVNGIEVIYNHVILVLKGVSLDGARRAASSRCSAPTAPARPRRCKAISNLLRAERGEVTKGSIVYRGERVDRSTPRELVKRGVVQVMEGRHCFAHLTVEENLLTGAYTRRHARGDEGRPGEGLRLLPAPEGAARSSQAGYTSGGEQQMTAIGRALMARPKMILLDEPSMGLAPQLVEEIFEIVKDLNRKERRELPARRAEHQRWRCATPTTATSSRTAAW